MDAEISRYMTDQPHSIRPGETLEHAKQVMEKFNIRHLPVVENKKIVGLITERDFSLVGLYPEMDLKKSAVEDLMLQSVYEVLPDTPLKTVVKEMVENKYGCAVIMNDNSELAGIFTSIDALKLLHKLYDND